MTVPQAVPPTPRHDLTARTDRTAPRAPKRFRAAHATLAIVATCMLFTSCGGVGGGDDGPMGLGDGKGGSPFGGAGQDKDGQPGGPPTTVGAIKAGPVTISTDPGHAVIEVDGDTIDHSLGEPGSKFYCDMTDDKIAVEIRGDVGTMTLNATREGDGWIGKFTADSEEEGWVQYTAQPFDGELGIDIDAATLSYSGKAERHDRKAMANNDMDTPEKNITLALNCGLEPATFEAGDTSLEFAPFASQSLDCTVKGPDDIDVTLNQLGTDDRQFGVEMRPDGDGAIGGMGIIEGDEQWQATISTNDGTIDNLEVDGNTVTYTGTFTHTSKSSPDDEEEVEGTGTVTCPG